VKEYPGFEHTARHTLAFACFQNNNSFFIVLLCFKKKSDYKKAGKNWGEVVTRLP